MEDSINNTGSFLFRKGAKSGGKGIGRKPKQYKQVSNFAPSLVCIKGPAQFLKGINLELAWDGLCPEFKLLFSSRTPEAPRLVLHLIGFFEKDSISVSGLQTC